MAPFGATTRWRAEPTPSLTTSAQKPAGKVRPPLPGSHETGRAVCANNATEAVTVTTDATDNMLRILLPSPLPPRPLRVNPLVRPGALRKDPHEFFVRAD